MASILNARSCKAARPTPGQRFTYYGDGLGHGLRLRVAQSGAKYWEQRLTVNGKRRDLGLGPFPEIDLDAARELALDNKRTARKGGNPLANSITFREASDACTALDAASWKTDKQRRDAEAMMDRWALPRLGAVKVAAINRGDVMDALEPIWIDRAATAKRVLQRLSRVFDYCVGRGYRDDNPADVAIMTAALPKQPKATNGNGNGNGAARHHEAVPYAELADALAKVDASSSGATVKALVRFTALTAARIGEARGAQWSEIDLDGAVWTIPADRMKGGREHRVPLADAAVAILRQQLAIRPRRCPFVFTGTAGRTIGEGTVRKLFRSLQTIGDPHGLRSSFRDWAAENTEAPREVLETCLAHVVGGKVERAYARTDLLDKRRAVMDAWADYLAR